MQLNSHDEWGQLREVILGTVDDFAPPLSTSGREPALLEKALEIVWKAYPKWYLDEVAEDLEGLKDILSRANVRVLRPSWNQHRKDFSTPNWHAHGFDLYNVRDLHAVFGRTLISSASASRFRQYEHYGLQSLIYDNYFSEGVRWIYAPPPRLTGDYLQPYLRARTPLEEDEDEKHQSLSDGLSETFHRLSETEILFDAANVVRVGEDILYLVSSTGNHLAGKWLSNVLGDRYRVHVTDAYRSSHLDSTILPLRPGVVLLNDARVGPLNCPGIFSSWERLYFGEVAPLPEEEVAFHRDIQTPVFEELRALGVESNLEHISSPWAGLNVLSIDPDTVLVHDRQVSLMRLLESRGFTVVPVTMRHCYTMLGGLHCSTLDTVRDGELADYR
jgi:glycine amidinotransferase